MNLTQDWHIHTFRSNCGKPENTIQAIAEALDRAGMIMAGISDHIDIPEQRDRLVQIVKENRADVQGTSSACRIYVGTEATMLAPKRCALDSDCAAGLDFVIAACNHYHLKEVENPSPGTPEAYARHHLDMIAGAIELGFVRTIAHPFLLSKLGPDRGLEVLSHYPEGGLSEVLKAASERGVTLEINPRLVAQALPWFRDLVQEAKRHGTRFTLGSDSHSLATLGYARIGDGPDPGAVCDEIRLLETDLEWMEQ